MLSENNNQKPPVKRGRGRPRKKTKTTDYVNEMQTSVTELTDFVEDKISSITLSSTPEIPEKFPKNELDRKSFYLNMTSQIDDLTQKIKEVDHQNTITKKKLKQLSKTTDTLFNTRSAMKNLIIQEQDKIYNLESELQEIDDSYQADIPDFFRFFLRIFSLKNQDEINLRMKVTKSETKINQRKNQLIQIHAELSPRLIALQGHQNIVSDLTKIGEEFRALRYNLSKLRRDIEMDLKNKQNEDQESKIMKDYLFNIEKLNEIGPNFSKALSTNKTRIQDLFKDFQGQTENSVDKMIDSLSNNLNNDQ